MTQPLYAYVGTRTTRERNARGEGISVYRVDADTGALERVQLVGLELLAHPGSDLQALIHKGLHHRL